MVSNHQRNTAYISRRQGSEIRITSIDSNVPDLLGNCDIPWIVLHRIRNEIFIVIIIEDNARYQGKQTD